MSEPVTTAIVVGIIVAAFAALFGALVTVIVHGMRRELDMVQKEIFLLRERMQIYEGSTHRMESETNKNTGALIKLIDRLTATGMLKDK